MTSDILFSLLIAVLSASPFMEQDLIDELLKEENRQQIEQGNKYKVKADYKVSTYSAPQYLPRRCNFCIC